jgi:hypothetical protein
MPLDDAARYAGVSRSTFYQSWLPKLRSAHVGKRRLVDRQSLDELIDQLLATGGTALKAIAVVAVLTLATPVHAGSACFRQGYLEGLRASQPLYGQPYYYAPTTYYQPPDIGSVFIPDIPPQRHYHLHR